MIHPPENKAPGLPGSQGSVSWTLPKAATLSGKHSVQNRHPSGLTLIEVMIAVAMFAILMAGALVAVLQTRRMAENNIGMAVARSVAQGIIEQARLDSAVIRQPDVDAGKPGADMLRLRFIGKDGRNFAAISQRMLPIEMPDDPDSWTAVGALSDPANPDSEVRGVLLDVEQRDASNNLVRPPKYMQMQVNFRIIANEEVRRHLVVALRYRWEPPVRRVDGSDPGWITREMRTAIAYTSTF
jgi:prepilin-type N-terminal cleavage/methylation domain-containing protein